MNSPLISIILPVYNGEKYLNKAICSCVQQTYDNLEIIIVNDASTDNSLQIAYNWAKRDSRIKIITNKQNLKLPASLNIGHLEAKGDYLTWTSDDNLYAKNAISDLYIHLKEYDCDIIYSEYVTINDSGNPTGISHLKEIEYLVYYGVIGACFLYKKEVFERNKGYDEKLFMVEDYDFWLRALRHSSYRKIENPGLYHYRYHSKSLTTERLIDFDTKEIFFNNLRKVYHSVFTSSDNKDMLVDYFIAENKKISSFKLIPLENWFFKNLKESIRSCPSLSFIKLKRIIINDLVEYILQNEKEQTFKNLISLHLVGGSELLRLSIERYLAIWKKCII